MVKMTAKLMRKNVHEIDLLVSLPFDQVVKHVSGVLGKAGRPVETVPGFGGGPNGSRCRRRRCRRTEPRSGYRASVEGR